MLGVYDVGMELVWFIVWWEEMVFFDDYWVCDGIISLYIYFDLLGVCNFRKEDINFFVIWWWCIYFMFME